MNDNVFWDTRLCLTIINMRNKNVFPLSNPYNKLGYGLPFYLEENRKYILANPILGILKIINSIINFYLEIMEA